MKKRIQAISCFICYILFNLFHYKRYDRSLFSNNPLFKKPWYLWWKTVFLNQKLSRKTHSNTDSTIPCSHQNTIICSNNIYFDKNDLRIFQGSGKYFQAFGKISIGKGTWIANNAAIITANHNLTNLSVHDNPEPVVIGDECWIGFGAIILPGVTLGNKVIVGAGSVVTHSFTEDKIVIAGNPAHIIKKL